MAYTRYMRNEGDTVFFRKTIGVVNTFRKDETIPTDTLIKATSPDISGNTLQLTMDKASFSRREQGHIRIRVYLLMCNVGNLYCRQRIYSGARRSFYLSMAGYVTFSKQTIFTDDYLPEYEGHLIRGKIVNVRTGEALVQTSVSPLLGFVGDEIRLFGGQQQEDKESVLFYTSRSRVRMS